MTKANILGVNVDKLQKDELLQIIESFLQSSEETPYTIATTYSEFIVTAQKDQEFKNILNSADINTADGIGILWAASYLARPIHNIFGLVFEFFVSALETIFEQKNIKDVIPEKISGADMIWDLCELVLKNNKSIYLLGGHGDVDKALVSKYSSLQIAGRYEGSPEEQGIVEKINSTNADILLVAFGPVRQEKWISQNKSNLKVKLIVGLGGTFDYVIGVRKRAPQVLQNLGLEWLHRLITQPWRIKRMWNAIGVFTWLVIKEKKLHPVSRVQL